MAEQWFDGANGICYRTRRVISYNEIFIPINAFANRWGWRSLEIPSSELSRGLGGPDALDDAAE